MSVEQATRSPTAPLVGTYSDAPTARTRVAGDHIEGLDGIRGVALLAVLMIHLRLGYVPGQEVQALQRASSGLERVFVGITSYGWLGVDLFFVLSGFLITRILLRTRTSDGYYASFYARRALRIFPIYYALLAGWTLVATGESGGLSWLWGAAYLQNIPMALAGALGPPVVAVTWSLAVEEQFYLVWPLLVKRLTRAQLVRVCLALVVIAPALRWWLSMGQQAPIAAYVLTPARADALAAGALLAVAHESGQLRAWLGWLRVGLVLGVALIGLATFAQGGFPYDQPASLVAGISGASLVFSCALGHVLSARRSALRRLFEWRWLQAIGRYSYAMYLLHFPICLGVQALAPDLWHGPAARIITGADLARQLLVYAGLVGLTFAAAHLSWVCVEQRFLALKHHFPRADLAG